jgi:AcrR family transcriptional regulator
MKLALRQRENHPNIQQSLKSEPILPHSLPVRSRGPKATKIHQEHILDAAQSVFAREGVQGASIRAIAREAGCDPALLYYHFQSKEGMFEAILARTIDPVIAELSALSDAQDPRCVAERLWRVIRIYNAHLGKSAGLRGLIRGEILRGAGGIQESITQRVLPALGAIGRLITLGIERREIREETPPLLATFFLARLELEILDLIPVLAPRVAGIPANLAVPMAEHAWFRLFWRGIAVRPDEPLPFLSEI